MDFEIGIVCGRCETCIALGARACPECGAPLGLEAPAFPLVGGFGAARAPFTTTESASMFQAASPVSKDDEPASVRAAPLSVRVPGPQPISAVEARRNTREIEAVVSTSSAPSLGAVLRDNLKPRVSVSPYPRLRAQSPHAPEEASSNRRSSAARISLEELMEQAKNYVCKSCSTAVPMGHKFCGRCGAAIPLEIVAARTQFFGQLQAPGRAKLILIRGEGEDGLSYQLNSEHHLVGRTGQLVFPEDPFVSPKHADLFYRDQKLVVKDEGSLNGVYLRIRGSVELNYGEVFMVGEQVLRLDSTPAATDNPAPDGTYFYSSPKHQTPFRVTQILQGGAIGMTVCARATGLQIGREGGDVNFPTDQYMSASHCKIEEGNGKITLTDLNSRNGTFIRIAGERELSHGDYLFIGKKLLRVEITAA
ncbi:MAG: FHA domain-containing protein [Polyangiaceae bacterium]